MGYVRRIGMGSEALPIGVGPQFKPNSWYYLVVYGQYTPEFPGVWLLGRQVCSSDQALLAYVDSCVVVESAACVAHGAAPDCAKESLWLRLYVYGNDEREWLWKNVNLSDEASEHGVSGAGCMLCGDPHNDGEGVLVNDCPSSAYLASKEWSRGPSEWANEWFGGSGGGTRWCQPNCGKFEALLRDVPPPPIGRPTPTKEMLKQMAAERDKLKSFPKPSGGTASDTSGSGKVPWAAIGIGAAAVGGLGLLWWAGRRS